MSSKRSVLETIKVLAQQVAFLLQIPPENIDTTDIDRIRTGIALAIGAVRALPCLEKYDVIFQLENADFILTNTTLYPLITTRLSLTLQLIELAALKAQLLNCGCC